ncbi:dihydrolipoyl dehydrogenase [Hyphococcus luteus]|uniref:Dihydrolipoyl dehydrogenase n=1 Tax=Hyphococcus luteus TaxID=2058213 RepID=A0A2S7K9B9_9PROT|nr:dihydrolipoyl dehydrogenase [Marinicaulis flavus]PQA89071.1 dihydrolipoyl dehydrogenase [Marinicaulis flavus]
MDDISCKLLVIGAGPGGYVAAIRAGQLGLDCVIVEGQYHGGTCLNVGCIPSKAIIHAADEFEKAVHFAGDSAIGVHAGSPKIDFAKTLQWKDGIVKRLTGGVGGLLKKNKVRSIKGWASFIDGKTVEVTGGDEDVRIRADNVIIATGSEPVELPFMPFGGDVISSTEALSLETPPKTLAVVGAGYIGLELGIAFAKLGTKVTVVEAMDKILPLYDKELTRPVEKTLKRLGVEVLLGAKAKGQSKKGLDIETADGKAETVKAEKILVTVGRAPKTQGWGRDNLVLDMDGRYVKIDDECQTSMTGVYAIGDVTGEPMLAHRAMAQGEMVAEIVAGENRSWDKRAIPAVCFTDPEIVSVGLSPNEAKEAGYEIISQNFPFSANGRAMSMEAEDGFVRIVARKDNKLVLGVQAAGRGVSELSTAFGLAIEMGATLDDIAGTIHAHPTLGEAFQESALRTLGHALHI